MACNFLGHKGGQFRPSPRRTDEARHTRGVAHHVPRVVGHHHLDQHISRENLALDYFLFPVFVFHFLFRRDENAKNFILHVHRVDTFFQIGFHLVFVPRIGVDHIPVLLHEIRA